MLNPLRSGYVRTCECGKKAYASRKKARMARRVLHHPGRLNAYRCHWSDYWHLGHLQDGDRDRDREWRLS